MNGTWEVTPGNCSMMCGNEMEKNVTKRHCQYPNDPYNAYLVPNCTCEMGWTSCNGTYAELEEDCPLITCPTTMPTTTVSEMTSRMMNGTYMASERTATMDHEGSTHTEQDEITDAPMRTMTTEKLGKNSFKH